jgi:beta-lactamase class C
VMDFLVRWKAPFPIGSKSVYSNLAVGVLGYAIAAEEHMSLQEVFERQYLHPLEMNSTFFNIPDRAAYRLVQGYNTAGHPIPRAPAADGWPAGGRLVSSGRDMGRFLAANLNEIPDHPRITKAMQYAQQPYFKASANMMQGLAWQRTMPRGELLIDKNGGLNGTSTYIGMLPGRKLGVVVLANRGKCQGTSVGRALLFALAGITPEADLPGAEDMDATEPGAE